MDKVEAKWWAQEIQPELSQGDVIADLPVLGLNHPTRYLKKDGTSKGGTISWLESATPHSDKDGKINFLAKGRHVGVLVLSHSCELDKNKKRVIVAPIDSITVVSEEHQAVILAQKSYALMPLPDVPGVGTCYADFRSITALDRRVVNEGKRIASMTEIAHVRLGAQIDGFFLRKPMA